MMPSLMTLFSLLQEARMAAKLLEKKFGIKDVSRREEYESIATVGEIRVYWRADFQSGSRVLKKVF